MNHIEKIPNGKRLLLLAMLVVCPLLTGCSAMKTTGEWTWAACVFTSKYTGCTYLGQKTIDGWNYCFSGDDETALADDDLSVWLRLEFEKPAYQPGEMAVCSVELVNLLDRAILIDPPVSGKRAAISNIQFIHIPEDSDNVLRRSPVVIAQHATVGGELLVEPIRLEPGAGHTSKFAFVNLTEKLGAYQVLARYTGNIRLVTASVSGDITGSPETKPLHAGRPLIARAQYAVAGPRLLQRDANGLITREEALRVAHAQYKKEFGKAASTEGAAAVLTETASELLDYWVTLQKMPSDVAPGADPKIAYIISPYGGFVREKTAPAAMSPKKFREEQAKAAAPPAPKTSGLQFLKPPENSAVPPF